MDECRVREVPGWANRRTFPKHLRDAERKATDFLGAASMCPAAAVAIRNIMNYKTLYSVAA